MKKTRRQNTIFVGWKDKEWAIEKQRDSRMTKIEPECKQRTNLKLWLRSVNSHKQWFFFTLPALSFHRYVIPSPTSPPHPKLSTNLSAKSSRCWPMANTLYPPSLAHAYNLPRFIREQKLQMDSQTVSWAACWIIPDEKKNISRHSLLSNACIL